MNEERKRDHAEAQRMQSCRENEIGSMILNTAIAIHREVGCGLLESAYETIMAEELTARGLMVETQKLVEVVYKGKRIGHGFRADMVVERCVIVELKSVEHVKEIHKKQLLTYLKVSNIRLGYLLNFGESLMKNGINRIVNQLPDITRHHQRT